MHAGSVEMMLVGWGNFVRRLLFLALFLAAPTAAAEPHVPVNWPTEWCDPEIVFSASPAPAASNSDSLAGLPFTTSVIPYSAAVIVSLTPENRPVIECVVDPGYETGFEQAAIEAVAGLVLSAPLAVNTAAPGGRYLVRVTTLFGISWIDPPPRLPILPACPGKATAGWLKPPNAPKPSSRVAPLYPARALEEEMEGDIRIVLDIFSNGDVVPQCFSNATPPGWFEHEALAAVSQYRFPAGTKRGLYTVTVKFRMED